MTYFIRWDRDTHRFNKTNRVDLHGSKACYGVEINGKTYDSILYKIEKCHNYNRRHLTGGSMNIQEVAAILANGGEVI